MPLNYEIRGRSREVEIKVRLVVYDLKCDRKLVNLNTYRNKDPKIYTTLRQSWNSILQSPKC